MESLRLDTFLSLIKKLEPVEFIGLARILQINLTRPTSDVNTSESCPSAEPRDFYEILDDIIKKYAELPRKPRRQILKMLREVTH